MTVFVDFDDTLVGTTELNNDAYNFALERNYFNRIVTKDRITRKSLPTTDIEKLNEIVRIKQKYFCEKWLPYRVVINYKLLERIRRKNARCFIWTMSSEDRVLKTIETLNIKDCFQDIIFDKKNNFSESIKLLHDKVKFDDCIIYENNDVYCKNQKCIVVDRIKDSNFDVNGYYVKV